VAVGNPYGRGPYGAGPYARYGTARPYGRGVYGTGPYAGWGGNTFAVGAATGIVFATHAAARLKVGLGASSSITFGAWSLGASMFIHPWARTEIVFSVSAVLLSNWSGWQPCETGAWASAVPCEDGGWAAPAGCSTGSWNLVSLT
jgi:hypothetical protein